MDQSAQELLFRLGEAGERIARLEQQNNDFIAFLQFTGFLLVGLLGISVWAVWKQIGTSVRKAVDDATASSVQDAQARIEAAQTEFDGLISDLAATAAGRFQIQSGELPVAFNNATYLNMTVKFPVAFGSVPAVFVSEFGAGAWVYCKVDSKNEREFVFAATVLGGTPRNHKMVLQWVAFAGISDLPKTDDPAIAAAAQ